LPLFDATSAASIRPIKHFGVQRLSNTVWAFSKLDVRNEPLMSAISASALRRMSSWHVQELVNTAWAVSKISFQNCPFRNAICSVASQRSPEYVPRDLSNTAWAFATCCIINEPILDSIAAEAMRKMSEFDEQACANTAFAFAALGLWHHERVLSAVGAKALTMALEEQRSVVSGALDTDSEPEITTSSGAAWHQLLDVLSPLVWMNSRVEATAANDWVRLD